MQDTGILLHYPETPKGIAQTDIDLHVKQLDDQQQLEDVQEDTLVPNSEALPDEYYSTAINALPEIATIHVKNPATEKGSTNKVDTNQLKR